MAVKKKATRQELIFQILGEPTCQKRSQYYWQCPFCKEEGHDNTGDNFLYNEDSGKYSCFANSDHTKKVSARLRELLYPQVVVKKTKREPNIIDIPQEVADIYEDRLIKVEILEKHKVKFDTVNAALVIPTLQMKHKFKPLYGDEFWETGTDLSSNTLYPANKLTEQKKMLILEGIPDIWAIESNFPEEFFEEFFVCGTSHGCTHIPQVWRNKKYWERFEAVYILYDMDDPGREGAKKLQEVIGTKANIIDLKFTNKRMVFGEEVEESHKDFNDWLIEGNTYDDFKTIVNHSSEYDKYIESEAWKMLKSPNFFDIYLGEIETIGLKGETNNKVAVYIENCSRLGKSKTDGISSKGQAPTAVGKTTLYKIVGKNFFKDDFIVLTSRSKQAIFYKGKDAWKYKIVMTEEDYRTKSEAGDEDKEYQMRIAKSEGILTYEVVEHTADGKHKIVNSTTIEGPWVFQDCTTKTEFKDEDINRDVVHNFDESSAQTFSIIESQKEEVRSWNPGLELERQMIIDKHRIIQRILKENIPDRVVIPYIDKIKFPSHLHRARRDFPKYLRYIQTVAMILQFQRIVVTGENYYANMSISEGENVKGCNNLVNHCNQLLGMSTKWLKRQIPIATPPNSSEFEILSTCQPTPIYTPSSFIQKKIAETRRIVISEPFDAQIVDKFISSDLAKEYSQIDAGNVKRYDILKNALGVNEEFTVKEAANVLGSSRQFAHKVLNTFEELGLCNIMKDRKPFQFLLLSKEITIDGLGSIGMYEGLPDKNNSVTDGGVDIKPTSSETKQAPKSLKKIKSVSSGVNEGLDLLFNSENKKEE